MSRSEAVLASFVLGMLVCCTVWMATYWREAAELERRVEACEARP